LVLTINSAALLSTMRLGGQIADRWSRRWPAVIGVCLQGASMMYLALLPGSVPLAWVVVGTALHNAAAGLYIAALHRGFMTGLPQELSGSAAALYGIFRYGGAMLGSAIGGVLLQWGLDSRPLIAQAYQLVFWFFAGTALLGIAPGWRLKQE